MKKKDTTSEDLQKLVQQAEDWKSKYLRALADYQNLEKRIVSQQSSWAQTAAKQLILKILPALDVFEKAQLHLKDQGLDLGLSLIRDVLKSEHVEKIEVIGKKFDPFFMECIELIESEKVDDVIEEVQTGFTFYGKVLRASRVKVGKKLPADEAGKTENKQIN